MIFTIEELIENSRQLYAEGLLETSAAEQETLDAIDNGVEYVFSIVDDSYIEVELVQ